MSSSLAVSHSDPGEHYGCSRQDHRSNPWLGHLHEAYVIQSSTASITIQGDKLETISVRGIDDEMSSRLFDPLHGGEGSSS
jgi:hypothetical protein